MLYEKLLQLHVWVIPQNYTITITLHPQQDEALCCFKHLASYHVLMVMLAVCATGIPQHQDSKICVKWKSATKKSLPLLWHHFQWMWKDVSKTVYSEKRALSGLCTLIYLSYTGRSLQSVMFKNLAARMACWFQADRSDTGFNFIKFELFIFVSAFFIFCSGPLTSLWSDNISSVPRLPSRLQLWTLYSYKVKLMKLCLLSKVFSVDYVIFVEIKDIIVYLLGVEEWVKKRWISVSWAGVRTSLA